MQACAGKGPRPTPSRLARPMARTFMHCRLLGQGHKLVHGYKLLQLTEPGCLQKLALSWVYWAARIGKQAQGCPNGGLGCGPHMRA
jgi:hypothetical protein